MKQTKNTADKIKKIGITKDGPVTIKKQIQSLVILILVVSLVLVGGISSILNYTSAQSTMKENMQTAAELGANQVYYRLKATMNLLEVAGTNGRLGDPELNNRDKKSLMESYMEAYGWVGVYLIDLDGTNLFDKSMSFAQEDYFQRALDGETVITDPVYSEETGELIIYVAAPLWRNGRQNTKCLGVVMATLDARELSDVVCDIKVSDNGGAYMISSTGDTIAHTDFELVKNSSNTIKSAETDSSLKKLAKLEQKMIDGENGFGKYRYNGQGKLLGYAPVGINGWSFAVTAPTSDFMGSTILGVVVTVVLLILSLVAGIYMAYMYGGKIGGAVEVCANRLKLLAQGDLDTEVPMVDTKDETRVLADSTAEIVHSQRQIIGDISYLLSEMAGGNFNVKSKIGEEAYIGAFREMFVSMEQLTVQLSDTIRSIIEAAEQVEMGSAQLAEGATELAEGATEQAGAVQQLFATVSDVTRQVEENNKATDEAHGKAQMVGSGASNSQVRMAELTAAMERIENTSNEIKNIIAGIEDIASQTNLLALNASIEAARAGEAGRGFAVVADQIGKLADQSAQSAVNTREMIESAILEIANGSKITDQTAEALTQVIQGVDDIVLTIAGVREASDRQTEAIGQIEQGVEQISGVVQSNSASAEQSSATSQELSAQAQSLHQLVEGFRLR